MIQVVELKSGYCRFFEDLGFGSRQEIQELENELMS
jgi:hypothetical protein